VSFGFELAIFGRPGRVDRRLDHLLEFGAGIGVAAHLEQGFGEKEM
jgi:hypothetical protein